MLTLVHAAVVKPEDEFGEYTPEMPLIPCQQPIQTFPVKRPYQPLNVFRSVCYTKKSHDHMALAWFFKKPRQDWESSGPGRLLTMYFLTVEQAWQMPNFISYSKAMRSSPYSG
jgi:hypothetical protein